jgi:hypothetical protein
MQREYRAADHDDTDSTLTSSSTVRLPRLEIKFERTSLRRRRVTGSSSQNSPEYLSAQKQMALQLVSASVH